jgi:hypothetical protein
VSAERSTPSDCEAPHSDAIAPLMRRAIPRVLRTINAKWALQYLRFLFHRTALFVSNRKDGILPLGKQQVNRVESTIVRLQLIADPGWIAGITGQS